MIVATPRTPADLARISTAVDNVFTGSYADSWENKALPAVLASPRSTSDIETIAASVAESFGTDDQAYPGLMTALSGSGRAADIAKLVRATDAAFTGPYADDWENRLLPKVLASPMGASGAELLDAIGSAIATDDLRHVAAEIVLAGPRSARDASNLVRGIDEAFTGGNGDDWEVRAVRSFNASARSGADMVTLGRAVSTSFATDDTRFAALDVAVSSANRPASHAARILDAIDALFTGEYGDDWELRATRELLPSRLTTEQAVGVTQAAARMASVDSERWAALQTLIKQYA